MADALRFEVRPIEGAVAVVGETVAFRQESGRLYALNEDGEAFGVVPSRFAAVICGRSVETLAAEVAERGEDGFLTLQVTFEEAGEGSADEPSAAAAEQAAPAAVPAESAAPAAAQIERTAQASPAVGEATEEATAEDDAAASGGTGPAAEPAAIEEGWSPQGKKKLPAWAKAALVVLAVIVVIVLVVATATSGSAEATQTMAAGHVAYEVPEDWTVESSDVDEDDLYEYFVTAAPDDFNGVITVEADLPSYYFTDDYLPVVLSAFGIEGDPADECTTDEGALVYLYEGVEVELEDSLNAKAHVQIVVSGDYASVIMAYCLEDEFDEHAEELLAILDTLTIIDAEEPTYSQAEEEEDTQSVTLGSVTIEVPESWSLEDTSYSNYTQTMIKADDFDATVFMTYSSYNVIGDVNEMDTIMSMRETDYGFGFPSAEYETTEGFVCRYEREPDDDNDWCYDLLIVSESSYLEGAISKYHYVEIRIDCAPDDFGAHAEELEAILDSMTIEEDGSGTKASESADDDDGTTSSVSTGEIVTALSELGTFEETTLSGSGDDVVDLPAASIPMLLEITNNGSSIFNVELLDGDGNKLDTLVYEIGSYSGTCTTYLDYSESTMLQIESDGSWSIICRPLENMEQLISGKSYTGDNVLYIDTDALTKITIENSGDSLFSVYGIGLEDTDHLVYKIGDYSGTVAWTEAQSFLIVESDGTWSVSW